MFSGVSTVSLTRPGSRSTASALGRRWCPTAGSSSPPAGERIEGTAQPLVSAVVEFPSMDALKQWYDCPAYRELRELRRGAVDADLLFVEGV